MRILARLDFAAVVDKDDPLHGCVQRLDEGGISRYHRQKSEAKACDTPNADKLIRLS